jgi:hypothetical protein
MFAASAFIVTAVLFTAAMVVAHSLSIPDPEERFLPSVARDLPSEPDSGGVALANDSGQAPVPNAPIPEVTAVPEPPSTAAGPVPREGASALSASGEAATAGGPDDRFTLSAGDTPPRRYTGPGWPSWGGSPAPPPSWEPTPEPSEPEPSEPDPSEPEPSEPQPSESESEEREPSDTPSAPVPSDEPSPSDEPAPSEPEASEPVASEGPTG